MGEAAARAGGPGLALAGLVAAALLAEQQAVTPQVDDAYIAYRYAANWLDGLGLVFNPGERVEGFTSPLWVMLVAGGMAGGLTANLAGHLLGLASAVAACFAATAYARALAPSLSAAWAGLAPALLLASAPFVRWTTGGLETVLFAALLTASLRVALSGRAGWLAGVLAVATLARPEGALVAAVLLGVGLAARRPGAPRALALYAVFFALLTGARFLYYGEFVPNTFHAKVGGTPVAFGVLYLWGFLRDGAALLLVPAAIAVASVPAARPGALLLVLFAGYVVLVGGDLLGESRFLVPLLPALAALAAVGAGLAWRRGPVAGPVLGAVAVASVAGAAFLSVFGTAPGGDSHRSLVLERARKGDRLFEAMGERRAALLRERGEGDVQVATGAIGSFGFHSRLPIVDILGLVDAEIARTPVPEGDARRYPGHLRSNAAAVFAREPTYLLIRERGSKGAGNLRAVADLWEAPALERDYAWDEELRGYRRREASAPAAVAPPPDAPNLLLVVVDTLRADRLGSYGAERPTSPALDRLAASGVRFARAYSPAPWTKPSVASIFTGLHPSAHGANRVKTALAEDAVTLAERLRAQGYRTAGVVSHDVLATKNGFAQGFERYFEDEALGHDHVSTEGVTRRALALLDELAAGNEPFFLFVHYFDPHYNYVRHPEFGFAAKGAGRLDGSQSLVSLRKLDLSSEEIGLLRDLYDEEIRYTDEGIGRLLAGVDRAGQGERTVVVATADHGEAFLEHGWLGHTRSLYDVLLRVPLIVRAPGVAPRVVEEPVTTVAVLPTVLELLGVPASDPAAQVASLAPRMRGEPASTEPLFAEVDFLPVFDPQKRAAKKALIGPRFKLIRDERSGKVELYDLEQDPGETRDLADAQPDRVESLLAELDERAEAAATGAMRGRVREPSQDELERLRLLGYGGD